MNILGFPKSIRFESQKYLDHVRSFACCNCGFPAPSDPDHFGPGRGIARKPDDVFTHPLCRPCHSYRHQHGRLKNREKDESNLIMITSQRDCLAAFIKANFANDNAL